jgi:hypothetical protein
VQDDLIAFLPGIVQIESCKDPLTQIIPTKLQEPIKPTNPTASIQAPVDKVSLCQDVTLQLTNILGDGMRPLLNVKW